MKNIYNKIFFVLAALFYGQAIEAYAYRIYNNTDDFISTVHDTHTAGLHKSYKKLGIINIGENLLFSLPDDKCLGSFHISDTGGSYWMAKKDVVCKNQDYDVRIKKDKDGNPITKTVNHGGNIMTRKLLDIVEINK